MKFLVLGGGGFMGRHLCSSLLDAGHEVRIFVNSNPSTVENTHRAGAEIIIGDFLNSDDIRRSLAGCDVIYHLVSTTLPHTSNKSPEYDIETNLLGTLRILEEAHKAQVQKIIFTSSGGTVYGISQKTPIKEDHSTHPVSSYGISKLAIEKYLDLFWKLYGLDYRVLRIANAYGDGQFANKGQGIIPTLLRNAIHKQKTTIWGDGSTTRDYVYIHDVVNALIKASTYNGKIKIFNIGTGLGTSLIELISHIEDIIGQSMSIKYLPTREFDVPFNVLDSTLAKTYLDWKPKVGLADGISRTYQWLQRQSP